MARKYKRDTKGRFSRTGSPKKTSAIKKQAAKNRAYAKKNWRGRGAYARQTDDMINSRGPYSRTLRGKPLSRSSKRANKIVGIGYYKMNPAYPISRYRGKKRK